jgi:hypothetical protein
VSQAPIARDDPYSVVATVIVASPPRMGCPGRQASMVSKNAAEPELPRLKKRARRKVPFYRHIPYKSELDHRAGPNVTNGALAQNHSVSVWFSWRVPARASSVPASGFSSDCAQTNAALWILRGSSIIKGM